VKILVKINAQVSGIVVSKATKTKTAQDNSTSLINVLTIIQKTANGGVNPIEIQEVPQAEYDKAREYSPLSCNCELVFWCKPNGNNGLIARYMI